MNKKAYQQPTMNVVRIQHHSMICVSVNSVDGNGNLRYGGGAAVEANSRGNSGWDDDE